jgi:two-component system, NtrC family, nitrogen regulation response regulator NtrX
MSGETVLVVDDEPDIRETIKDLLEDESYRVLTAATAAEADQVLSSNRPDCILLDIWMPDTDGLSLLRSWSTGDGVDAPVVMISGHGNVETAVEAIRYGAYDFLEKPLSTAKLLVTVERALQNDRLRRENQRLRRQIDPVSVLVGSSAAMREVRERIERIATTDSWVLITGEPGSGKGTAARAIHNASARSDNAFVEISLAATPPQNIAVQLFGSEGEGVVRPGRFEQAKGGTLLLDEVGDMDLSTQAKLLGAFQEGRFLRVGGQTWVDIDVHVIAATNQDLDAAVGEGRFREDLFYRLNVLPLLMPALREHREDIPELVEFYLAWMVEQEGLPRRRFTAQAIDALGRYRWPGNVRELKNVIQRLLILNRGESADVEEIELALGTRRSAPATNLPPSIFDLQMREARDEFERLYLTHHLRHTGGNVSDLAGIVGMERTHLYRKLKGLGVDPRLGKDDAR